MSGLILETETEFITFGEDGHLLHTHKTTFAQRRSLNTWPDFQSAKKGVSRIDRLCITCCSPSQPSHHAGCPV